jgi:membrane-bound metal-dependent hydrolase YbcI (DUF457 family)
MPVLGHALVGLATAMECEPQSRRDGLKLGPRALALWTPLVVGVSYLPDVITQTGSLAGVVRASLVGHSLIVGAIAGGAIGFAWAWATGVSFVRSLAVSIGSILAHDILDMMVASDRAPFWPWSTRIVSISGPYPHRPLFEAVTFVVLFAGYVVWRLRSDRPSGTLCSLGIGSTRGSATAWAAWGAVLVLMLTAFSIRGLRGQRERAAREAGQLLDRGRYAEALRIADTADHWPWPARPGRLDLLRGEAHDGLGESAVAERYFLQAYEKDPTNFWAVADLAEFYAGRSSPAAERRRATQPYADELRTRFPAHERLPEVLARVDRKLADAD